MKYLRIFKTTQTMYYDYDNCYWDTEKPCDSKYGIDYCLMRIGTKLKAHELEEGFTFDYENYKIELTNGRHQVYFKDLNDVYECNWLEELKSDNTL